MRARTIRINSTNIARSITKLRTQLAEVQHDAGLTPAGRQQRMTPIQEEIARLTSELRVIQHGLLEGAREELTRHAPAAEHRRAALAHPERAAALTQLAKGLSEGELLALAREAANPERPDAVAAWAIRHGASDRLLAMDEGTRAELHALLGGVSATAASSHAVADLVVSTVELARFEQMIAPVSGADAVTRARQARTVDLGEGARTLTDAELNGYYARLRLPMDLSEPVPRD